MNLELKAYLRSIYGIVWQEFSLGKTKLIHFPGIFFRAGYKSNAVDPYCFRQMGERTFTDAKPHTHVCTIRHRFRAVVFMLL